MKKIESCTSVTLNADFFCITTMSQGMLNYLEPDVQPHYLAPSVDDSTLGKTLRTALAASKRVSVEEFQAIFHSGVIQKLGDERMRAVMQKYGYKTKRAMYKNMDKCSVDLGDGKIVIQPMHHKSIDGYSATTSGPESLVVDAAISDAELGAALRDAFKRCTSSV